MNTEISSLEVLQNHLNLLQNTAQKKQTLDSEEQKIYSKFLSELEDYLSRKSSNSDSESFQKLCKRISTLDSSYLLPESILKNLCSYMQRILPDSSLTSLFTLENLCKGTLSLINSGMNFPMTLYGFFVDGQHAWKQRKYECVLQSILKAIEKETLHSVDLQQIYERLKSIRNEDKTPLQQVTLQWLTPLLDPSPDPRTNYRQFIEGLRFASQQPEFLQQKEQALSDVEEDSLIKLTKNVCYYRFAKVNLYAFCENLVMMMLHEGMKNLVPDYQGTAQEVFSLPLLNQFKAIRAASLSLKEPQAWSLIQKASASMNLYYDPQLKSNIPFVFCDFMLTQNHGLRILRMGTPNNSHNGVNPEFKLFLTSCEQRNEKILYVSEQAEGWVVEAHRNYLNKQMIDEFKNIFFMVILSKDTPFYHQSGEYSSSYLIAQEFKDLFLAQLKSSGTGYYFNDKWLNNAQFTERLARCLNEIHEDVFSNERLLSRQQRLDFIEIAYARLIYEIIDFLKFEHQILINFLSVTCRDCNDRAVITLILLIALGLHYLGKYHLPEMQQMLMVFIHSPKMLVMKEEMNGRRERLISALAVLNQPEVMISLKVRQQSNPIVSEFISPCNF